MGHGNQRASGASQSLQKSFLIRFRKGFSLILNAPDTIQSLHHIELTAKSQGAEFAYFVSLQTPLLYDLTVLLEDGQAVILSAHT